jgi:energy-coupling factor transporter transmembrane protein EcfT
MEQDFIQEQEYIKAKKKVRDIKGFYIHLFLYILVTPIIIITNLMFAPSFHWFWFSVLGWGLAVFFHWMGVFGFKKIGFTKEWEENKIKELMEEQNKKYNESGK